MHTDIDGYATAWWICNMTVHMSHCVTFSNVSTAYIDVGTAYINITSSFLSDVIPSKRVDE